MSYGVIYCITNTINNKKYIGLTTRSIKQRFKEHTEASSYIGRAIRKYGDENFTIDVIDETYSKDELCDSEVYWIEKHDTFNNGYNLTRGGEGVINYTEVLVSLNDRQKRFISCVEKENKKDINIKNDQEVVASTLINIAEIYLRSKILSDKQKAAKLINSLKPSYKQFIEKFNVIDFEEMNLYI